MEEETTMSVLERSDAFVNHSKVVHKEPVTEKWPIWIRLITIVGLSAGLWGALIWATVALFG